MSTSALSSFTHPPPHLSTSTLPGTSPSPWGGGGTSRTSRFPSSPSFAKCPLFSSSSSLKVSSIEIRRSLHFHMESSALLQDACATAVVMGGAYSLVSSFDLLTTHNFIDQRLSRKLVHVLSGLLFMASWPIFSTSLEARYFAALVPLANCLRLLAYGLSLATDEAMVKSMSREGKPEELLRGPMYYVVMLMLCNVLFWRNSPVGVISLAMMCGGDGFADIMGRRYGTLKLPYNQDKSWAGSICMCFSGFAISIGPASGTQSEFLWKTKALPRVLAFGWLVLCGSVLTLDNLHRRHDHYQRIPLVPFSCRLVDHLLLNCMVAQKSWIHTLDAYFVSGFVLALFVTSLKPGSLG